MKLTFNKLIVIGRYNFSVEDVRMIFILLSLETTKNF